MRVIKTKGRRGNGDIFYTVDGVASCGTVEEAFALLTDDFALTVLETAPVAVRGVRAGEIDAQLQVAA